jgi:hypothetical protein
MSWRRVGPYLPLAAHVLPTLLIGYGVVIPRSGVAGSNELTIGFGASIVGTCVAYVIGLRLALRPSCAWRPRETP